MPRQTKRERDQFEARWLRERMPHRWSDAAPTICVTCGAKYTAAQVGKRCPKRRRPNRWRMHCNRAQYNLRESKPADLYTAAWWLREITEVRREVKRIPELQPDHPRYGSFWTYHKLARRYRKALRELWRSTSQAPIPDDSPNRGIDGAMTAARNKLLRQAKRDQSRVIQVQGCKYIIYADAQIDGRPVFQA